MISHNPHQRPDAAAISVWVKGHLRNVVDPVGTEDWLTEDDHHKTTTTLRSNSSPANISLSRTPSLFSTSPTNSDSTSQNDSNFPRKPSRPDGERNRFIKSKSFSYTTL